MKTRDEAVSFLYSAQDKFCAAALPVFQVNQWTWVNHRSANSTVPELLDIQATVSALIWECVKHGGQNLSSTGRIQVFVRQTDAGDWISGIQLVPVSQTSY